MRVRSTQKGSILNVTTQSPSPDVLYRGGWATVEYGTACKEEVQRGSGNTVGELVTPSLYRN